MKRSVNPVIGKPFLNILAGLALSFFFAAVTLAQTTPSEYEIKAAYLYQFANYVEWPVEAFSNDVSPVVFGILEAENLADILEGMVENRRLNGRSVLIRRLKEDDEISGLHVLFIGQSRVAEANAILLNAANMSILTVTELPSERPSGSIINFEIVEDRVRFDVSLNPVERGSLKISPRLLQVAQRIIN